MNQSSTASGSKKPGLAFWATAVVVVGLVAYPLSFGPASWISSRMNVGANVVSITCRPLLQATSDRSRKLLGWYAHVGAAPGWVWGCGSHSEDWEWAYVGTI